MPNWIRARENEVGRSRAQRWSWSHSCRHLGRGRGGCSCPLSQRPLKAPVRRRVCCLCIAGIGCVANLERKRSRWAVCASVSSVPPGRVLAGFFCNRFVWEIYKDATGRTERWGGGGETAA